MGLREIEIATEPIQELRAEFAVQAERPPGGDRYIAGCYRAVGEMFDDPRLNGVFDKVLKNRKEGATPTHLVNLFLRAIQYQRLFEAKDSQYPQAYESPEAWKRLIGELITDEVSLDLITSLMTERDTGTTIYQRYAGVAALVQKMNKPVKAMDIGCGGGYGLSGMLLGEEFLPVSGFEELNQLSRGRINIIEGLGLDKNPAFHPNVAKWRLACGFYPQELGNMPKVAEFEARIQKATGFEFLHKDIFEDHLPVGHFDLVTICTMLYQIPERQGDVYDIARQSIAKGGLLVVQDFAELNPENPTSLKFLSNWGNPYSYATFVASEKTKWEFKELIRWRNGRCVDAKMGRDWEKLDAIL